jgi:hypothetical protein
LLQGIEGRLAFLGPGPRRGLVSETCERDYDVQVVQDETTIEVGKAKERLYILHFSECGPLEDGIDLVRGHMKTFGGEHKTKILDCILVELTFVRPDVQAVLLESAKDFFYVLPVRGEVVGEDEDVVQIDNDTVVEEILKYVVHETLESGRGIGKFKRHYQPLKRAVSGSEGGFPLIAFGDLDQVVCVPEIDLGVDASFAGGLKEVRD